MRIYLGVIFFLIHTVHIFNLISLNNFLPSFPLFSLEFPIFKSDILN